ncbi:PTS galactosamine/N-acetylgalactosamine transporter subunit IIA [Natribacillus halophilus]|uniref:PTS system, N-acetylgalactosamine-specific IIA component n=1 Tax=Natribacillus halophilus TaxID=549003 RepID=A0A1G8N2P1_9BACI|nr:PTS galactosamine/N-acetylgalactosamine transporter subunit IIA [Natribacillus halophilus]SDI74442.1 PTS system, N-acetylgalactosamine-specific IIA component [Natribacillus halophilus]
MIGIVVTGHGTFPQGMYQALELIVGEQEQVKAIPFEDDKDQLKKDIEEILEVVDTGDGVVFFTDLAGGTPFNTCVTIASEKQNGEVVGGTNLPMILSGMFQRELPLDEFVKLILQEGKENIKIFEEGSRKTQESTVDGI